MSKPSSLILTVSALILFSALKGASAAPYVPASRAFSCDIKDGWEAFEEDGLSGPAAHLLAPAPGAGKYRPGIDIHSIENGKPGFTPLKKALESLRRKDEASGRSAGAARRVPTPAGLAHFVEVRESRRVPSETAPSQKENILHAIALLPNGDSYFLIRLSSPEDSYLGHRDEFFRLLKSFRIAGY